MPELTESSTGLDYKPAGQVVTEGATDGSAELSSFEEYQAAYEKVNEITKRNSGFMGNGGALDQAKTQTELLALLERVRNDIGEIAAIKETAAGSRVEIGFIEYREGLVLEKMKQDYLRLIDRIQGSDLDELVRIEPIIATHLEQDLLSQSQATSLREQLNARTQQIRELNFLALKARIENPGEREQLVGDLLDMDGETEPETKNLILMILNNPMIQVSNALQNGEITQEQAQELLRLIVPAPPQPPPTTV